jgi:hypothetical protein
LAVSAAAFSSAAEEEEVSSVAGAGAGDDLSSSVLDEKSKSLTLNGLSFLAVEEDPTESP